MKLLYVVPLWAISCSTGVSPGHFCSQNTRYNHAPIVNTELCILIDFRNTETCGYVKSNTIMLPSISKLFLNEPRISLSWLGSFNQRQTTQEDFKYKHNMKSNIIQWKAHGMISLSLVLVRWYWGYLNTTRFYHHTSISHLMLGHNIRI